MRNPEITPAHDKHRGQAVVSLSFEKDDNFHGKAKVPPIVQWNVETCNCESLPSETIKSTIWSQSRNFWYIPQSNFKGSDNLKPLKVLAWVDYWEKGFMI